MISADRHKFEDQTTVKVIWLRNILRSAARVTANFIAVFFLERGVNHETLI